MPGSEDFVQSTVRALEAGGFGVWVKRGAVALGIVGLIFPHFYQFRDLSTSVGMPIMTCYGLAYLLVQWNRLTLSFPSPVPALSACSIFVCDAPDFLNALAVPAESTSPMATLPAAVDQRFERLDATGRSHRDRHALGRRMVCRSSQLVVTGENSDYDGVQRLQNARRSRELKMNVFF